MYSIVYYGSMFPQDIATIILELANTLPYYVCAYNYLTQFVIITNI